jgi:hypothetical protein
LGVACVLCAVQNETELGGVFCNGILNFKPSLINSAFVDE